MSTPARQVDELSSFNAPRHNPRAPLQGAMGLGLFPGGKPPGCLRSPFQGHPADVLQVAFFQAATCEVPGMATSLFLRRC